MTDTQYPTGPVTLDDISPESPFTLPGFFAALADDRVLGVHCTECGEAMIPPRPACYACGSQNVSVREQPRAGTIVSYTAVHRPPSPFADRAPLTLAVVELDSGARLTGRVNATYEAVAIGDPVELVVEAPTEAEQAAAIAYEADWPVHAFDHDERPDR